MTTEIILSPRPGASARPALHANTQGREACSGILPGQINNDHTRKAYLNAKRRFAAW